MGAGGSAPKEEQNDGQPPLARRGSFDEEGDDTERRMLADPSTPRNLSHPIESKDHFDDEAPPQTSARSVSFRDPAHSVRDKKSSSTLLREMEKREQEELRVQTEAIHVLDSARSVADSPSSALGSAHLTADNSAVPLVTAELPAAKAIDAASWGAGGSSRLPRRSEPRARLGKDFPEQPPRAGLLGPAASRGLAEPSRAHARARPGSELPPRDPQGPPESRGPGGEEILFSSPP